MKVLIAHSRYRTTAPSGENLVVDQETAALPGRRSRRGSASSGAATTSDPGPGPTQGGRAGADLSQSPEFGATSPRRLVRERPDVLHVHNTFPLLSPSVLLAARDAGVPVVATIHNYKLLCASGDFFRDGTSVTTVRVGDSPWRSSAAAIAGLARPPLPW